MKLKKGLSLVLSLILAAQLCLPVGATAVDAPNADPGAGEIVCTHHNQHTAECGYTAEGAVCTFDPATCKECNPQPAEPVTPVEPIVPTEPVPPAEPTVPDVPAVPDVPLVPLAPALGAPKAELLANGAIDISGADKYIVIEDDGYTIGVGSKVSYTGPYVLTGSTTETNAPATGESQNFTKNSHIAVKNTTSTPIEITLNDVDIQFANIDERPLCPFSIDAGAVNLTLLGSNKLTGSYLAPGLCVEEGANLTVTKQSTGSLTAISVNSSMDYYNGAGIGGRTTNGGSITILGGTVSATGSASEDFSDNPGPGISGSNVTISGGSVTAIGGDNPSGHDQVDIGIGGSFSANGNAAIFASSIKDKSNKKNWHGIIFEGDEGFLYGNSVAPNTNITIPSGKTLFVTAGQTLIIPAEITLQNNGTIDVSEGSKIDGKIKGNQPSSRTKINISGADRYIVIEDDGYTIGTGTKVFRVGPYVLTGSTTFTNAPSKIHISVRNKVSTPIDITLDYVDIQLPFDGNYIGPFSIDEGAVNLTLVGANLLKCESTLPALRVEIGKTLTITAESTGSLTARGGLWAAGIGGAVACDAGTINIKGGVINALSKADGAGIGGGGATWIESGTVYKGGNGGNVTISGGVVTASRTSKEGSGIGGGREGGPGTFAATGNALIFVTSISDQTQKKNWNGIFFENSTDGAIYGNGHITLSSSITIPSGYILYMKEGQTLTVPKNKTLTASGFIYTYGGNVDGPGNIVHPENILFMPTSNISSGNVIIGKTPGGIPCSGPCRGHRIIGSSTTNHVIVDGGKHNIVLMDAHICNASACAFELRNGASVDLTILGDNTLGSAKNYAGIQVPGGNTLSITDKSTGTLTVTGGDYAAGIGGGYNLNVGSIFIQGGTVKAHGGYEGAGIGGGAYGAANYIKIDGGTVNAVGGVSGAGIGSGYKAPIANPNAIIRIDNGIVTATGGSEGAGIGGGDEVSGGIIKISGGTVKATASYLAAGIGGGDGGSGGEITITGGVVIAQGGTYGAGIGGGEYGSSGKITINGHTVVSATRGDKYAEDIGPGYGGQSGEITITKGVIFKSSAPYGLMYGDITIPEDFTIPITAVLKIFAGQTLTIPNGRTLTVDGGIGKAGEIRTEGSGKIVHPENVFAYVHSVSQDPVSISSCGISCPGHLIVGSTTANSITVTGGTHNITLKYVSSDVSGTTSAGAFELANYATVNLTLAGTNTLKSGNNKAGLQVPVGSEVTIHGGSSDSLSVTGGKYAAGIGGSYVDGGNNGAGTVTITGGTVTAHGHKYGAGIGGGYAGAGGNITIDGGKVTARGGWYGAGIGGGDGGGGGTITINGGTVTATGDSGGAGIGGGSQDADNPTTISGGIITINGGTVTAKSNDTSVSIGAGIGSGAYGSIDSITINGGHVKAESFAGGAAIGTGALGTSGTVYINGGDVTATSHKAGAGIGSGDSGKAGVNVTITGGIVNATGGQIGKSDGQKALASAGIGGGGYARCGTINITGGTVYAQGTEASLGQGGLSISSAGIGGGSENYGANVIIGGDAFVFAVSGGERSAHIGKGELGDPVDVNRAGGIIFEGGSGHFYGSNVALKADVTLLPGKDLTIPSGKTLTIPSGKTFANHANLFLDGGSITGAGSINGIGSCKATMTSEDIGDIPDQVCTGKAIEPPVTVNSSRNILGKTFTVLTDDFTKNWRDNINAGTAKVTYTRSGYTSAEKTFTIVKSGTVFDGGVKVYKGTTETADFIYGDTITVKAKPKATGVPANKARAFQPPAENQMALYLGSTQISDPASPDNSGVYTMTYNTTGKALALGSNAITARYIGTSSMVDAFGDVSVTLRAKALTATITSNKVEKVYDGTVNFLNIPLTLTGVASGDTVTATANGATPSANAGTRAFTASAVTLGGANSSYYTLAPADVSGSVTITPATPTVKLTVTQKDGGLFLTATTKGVNNEKPNGTVVFTYGSRTVIATVSAVDGVASYQWDNPPAGEQTITANFGASSGNYKSDVVTDAVAATVGKQEQNALVLAPVTGKTYGDGSFALSTTGGNGNGAVSYSVTGDAITVSGNTATIAKIGTVTITATKAEDSNYKPATSAPITITVAAKPVTVTVTAKNKVYDGNTTAQVSYIVSGTVGKDELTATGTAAFDTKAAGNGKTVTATGISISGAKEGNYTLTKNTATTKASITQKPLTWGAGGKVNSKEYDGGTSATVATNPILIGVFSSDTVSVTNGTVAFAGANVGTHAITATGFGIEGADSANYTAPVGQPVFANGSITVKNITPTVTVSGSYTFNGKQQIPTITVKNGTTVIPDTDYAVTYGTNINAGTGSVKVTLNGNYNGNATANFHIGKAATSSSTDTDTIWMKAGTVIAYTIPLPAISNAGAVTYEVKTITDAGKIFSVNPTIASASLTFTSASDATNGEKATVVITVKSENYKDFNVTLKFEATGKTAVTITGLTAENGTYNGSAQLGYTGTITVAGGKVSTDVLVYKYTGIGGTSYSNSKAPTQAGSYKLTIEVKADNKDYTGSHKVITFTIDKAPITVKQGNYTISKVWDGNTKVKTTGSLTVTGGVPSDTVTVAATPHDYPSSSVGNHSVTVDLALTDTSGNYVLENSTITVLGAITAGTAPTAGAPSATPELRSDTSITLKPVTVYGETVEYAMSETTTPSIWQDSTTFGTLRSNTKYYFFARVKANDNHGAGTASTGTAITTAKKVFEETKFTITGGEGEIIEVTGAQLLQEPKSFLMTNNTAQSSDFTPANALDPFMPQGAAFTKAVGPAEPQVMESVTIDSTGKLVFTSKKNPVGFVATDVYTITVSSNDYRDFVFTMGFSASEKGNATITATLNGKEYDGAPVAQPTPSAKVGSVTLDLQYTYQWKQGDTALSTVPRNAGDYTLVITGSNDNYAGSLTIPFTIDKKPLTVTATDKAVVFGATPEFTFTSSGLVPSETLTAVAYNCSYDKSKPNPGMARTAIIPHGGTVSSENGNYAISYVPGTLTINPDKNALSAAIAAAEALKSSVERLDKAPSEVESGKQFVTSNVMTALESAITGAKQVATSAMTPQEIADAMTALTSATEAFVAAIQTGSYSYDSVDWGDYPKPSKPSADRFIDIKGHWAEASIRFVVEESLFNGISHTLFAPDMNMTRGMLVTVLYRQAGSPTVEASGSEWYSSARAWAMQTAISDGTSMDDAITRQELVTMLHRYAKHSGIDVSVGEDTNILSYNDAFDLPLWSIPAFQWSCGADIVEGTNENLLPASLATRAEVATMLQRFVGLKTK